MDTSAPEGLATPTHTPARLANTGATHWVTVERPVLYVHPGITAAGWELTHRQSALRYCGNMLHLKTLPD